MFMNDSDSLKERSGSGEAYRMGLLFDCLKEFPKFGNSLVSDSISDYIFSIFDPINDLLLGFIL